MLEYLVFNQDFVKKVGELRKTDHQYCTCCMPHAWREEYLSSKITCPCIDADLKAGAIANSFQ
jgi:hypothetical protein